MRGGPAAATLVAMLLLAPLAPPAHAAPVLDVLLASPQSVGSGATVVVSGVVEAASLGAPAIEVALLVDGGRVASATSDANGAFAAAVPFPARRGTATLEAVALGGTPLESRSATYTVRLVVPPSVPLDLTATLVDGQTARLAWSRPADDGGAAISRYAVEHALDGGAWTEITTTPANTRTYEHRGILPSATHAYRVVARNVAGSSPPSAAVSLATPPSAPTDVVAVETASGIHVTWDAPAPGGALPVTGYQVHRNGGIVGETSALSFDEAKVGSTYYEYRVRAVGPAGPGPWSGVAALDTKPDPPASLTATYVPNSRAIRLEWTPPPVGGGVPVLEYRIERLVGNAWTLLDTVDADVLAYERGGLAWDTTYTHRVRAVNHGGVGAPTQPANATLPPQTATTLTMTLPHAIVCHEFCETYDAGPTIWIWGPTASFKPIVKGRLMDQAGEGFAGPQYLLIHLEATFATDTQVTEEWILTTTAGNYTDGIDPYVTFTGQAVGECRDIDYWGQAQYMDLFATTMSTFTICRAG